MKTKNFDLSLIFTLSALLLSFGIAYTFIGPILNQANIVQDDFRQCCYWFWQFWQPDLFQNDFFVDSFKTLSLKAPLVLLLYKISPFFTSNLIWYTKLIALITIFASGFVAYLFFKNLLQTYFKSSEENEIEISELRINIQALCFAAVLIVVTTCTDHISAAHSRAFLWFGLLFYMYLDIKKQYISANIFNLVMLFLSPHVFLINNLTEFFNQIKRYLNEGIKEFKLRLDTIVWIANNVITLLVYLFFYRKVQNMGVGEAFSVEEMKKLAEFNPGGRHPIFASSIWDGSWWTNEHWGLGIGYLEISKLILLALALVGMYLLFTFINKEFFLTDYFKLSLKKIFSSSPAILILASYCLYFIAQIVYPKLYLPSRYIAIPSLLLSIIVIFVSLVYSLEYIAKSQKESQRSFVIYVLITLSATGAFYLSQFKHMRYVSVTPSLIKAIQHLPKSAMIAAHPGIPDISGVSLTAQRSAYIDYERSMSYTKPTLMEIRRRTEISLKMTYATSKEEFVGLAKAEGITHFIAHAGLYTPQYKAKPRYIEPYNKLLRSLTKAPQLFVEQYLRQKRRNYDLIDISSLEK